MRIAVIGSGGREHAIVYTLAQSTVVEQLYAFPGNDAIGEIATCVPVDIGEIEKVADLCVEYQIDLVVIGPEAPLTNGLADLCRARGLLVFGPNKAAARLEGSKIFAKELMAKYHIPTASYAVFSEAAPAKDYIRKKGAPIVIKADGLAAGKGVVVARTLEEALRAVDTMMKERRFGTSGGRIVIEECMEGEEVSVLAFVDGTHIVPMVSAQDHKRIFDGDKGPNTGGMGAYAPAPVMTEALLKETEETILRPIIRALQTEGISYNGCLYAGLMITDGGPKVVEFNCRFGDPETQAILPLLAGDLGKIMYDCATGNLSPQDVTWHEGASCCVIMASQGYPQTSHKGDRIEGLEAVTEGIVFHSGTKKNAAQDYETAGGRVLGVTARAHTLEEAVQKAYAGIAHIHFDGNSFRHDIGAKGLAHYKNNRIL